MQNDNNPFDDFLFWLTIVTIDFGFFGSEKGAEQKTDKQELLSETT